MSLDASFVYGVTGTMAPPGQSTAPSTITAKDETKMATRSRPHSMKNQKAEGLMEFDGFMSSSDKNR
ncbi:hypothetical protein [Burkholderia gladioli]|uniref:hypothetical protein n=1 Tax=Burkholderia gladioli TaxID=28095 RepID=UPI00264EE731|nr:hypothetical protein [Burkholderia gladioli]MDN7719898.1 hypothetical protein [Burkholderia gladioli]